MPELAKPALIKRLVFSGGGARGVFYPGAYAALQDTGVFCGVEQIAGSSAGAVTASLLAVGMSCDAAQKQLLGTDLSELLGEISPGSTSRSAQPLYAFIKKNLNQSIYDFLAAFPIENLNDECQAIVQKLEEQTEDASITFRDLDVLRLAFPQQFKDLTVTAVRKKGGRLQLFNAEDTPDVEIALACKASGAIVGELDAVEINGESYVDGGLYDNIPVDSFDEIEEGKYSNTKPEQTLVFAFLEGKVNQKMPLYAIIKAKFLDMLPFKSFLQQYLNISVVKINAVREYLKNPAVFKALYGDGGEQAARLFEPTALERFVRNFWLLRKAKMTLDYKPTDMKEAGFQKIRSTYPLRTVGLNVENMLSPDFKRATEHSAFFSTCGYLDTTDMIFNHDLQSDEQRYDEFCDSIVNKFIENYTQALQQAGKRPANDPILKDILPKQIGDTDHTLLSNYYLIREKTEKEPGSLQSVALTVAVAQFRDEIKAKERSVALSNTTSAKEWQRAFANVENPAANDNPKFRP